MKSKIGLLATIGLFALALPGTGLAQAKKGSAKKPAKKVVAAKKPASSLKGEVRLVGINLMDDGIVILNKFGTPDDIQAVGGGGGAIGPTGGAAAGGRGGGFTGGGNPRGNPRGGGGGGGGAANEALSARPGNDFDFENTLLLQGAPAAPSAAGASGGGGGGAAPRIDSGAPGAGGGGGAAGGTSDKILYTRWVYKRGPSRYGFVLNKFNKIVQIEAIGMNDKNVRTSRGIGFGANFAQLIRTYGAPDGYEINGNSLVVRYLVRNKVAFRLSRLGENKPHVVTGVVVAGGKM